MDLTCFSVYLASSEIIPLPKISDAAKELTKHVRFINVFLFVPYLITHTWFSSKFMHTLNDYKFSVFFLNAFNVKKV